MHVGSAQTTYYWVGGTGTKTLNTLANWNTTLGGGGTAPGSLSNANIFIVDGDNLGAGATGALTLQMNANAALGQLIIKDNSQSVTLTGTSAFTLTVGGTIAGDDWVVASGCSLSISTNSNVTLTNVYTAAIAGTVTIGSGSNLSVTGSTNALTTVTGSLVNSGTISSSVAVRFVFASGSVYEHAQNGGAMPSSTGQPLATFNTGSTCKVTGVTSSNPTNNEGTYHHYIWDCPDQTTATGATTAALTVNGDLTIGNNAGSKLTLASTTTINGTTTVGGAAGGTLSFTTNSTKTFNGDVIVASGAIWDNSINEAVSFNGNLTNNGTFNAGTAAQTFTGDVMYLENNGIFNAGSGIYTFTGSFRTIKGSGTLSLATLTLGSNSSLTNQLTSGTGLTITTDLNIPSSGSFSQGNNSRLALSFSTISVTGSFGASATGNTVNYSASGNQTIPVITHYNITTSGSGTKTFNAGGFVYGDVNITGSSTLSITTNATRIFGHTTIASSCTLNVGTTIAFDGDLINQGTIVPGTNALQFDGDNDSRIQTIRSGGNSLYEVHFRNEYNNPYSIVLADDMTITSRLNLYGGRVSLGNNNLTLGASATVGTSIPTGGTMADIMVLTDGTGMLRKVWGTTGASFTFPVGDITGTAEYSPVALTVTHSSAPTIGVRVVDAAHPSVNSLSYISRYWVFSSSGGTTTNYSFASPGSGFTYLDADVVGTESDLRPSAWNGSAWTALSGGGVNTSTNLLTTSTITSPALNGLEITGRREPVTYTWSGTGGDWQTAGNWTPTRTTPAADDRLVIGSSTGTFTITNVPTQTIARLTVNSSVNVTLSPAASGNILTVSDGSAAAADITISSSGSLTVGQNLVLNMNTDATVSAGLTNSGTLTVNGQLRLGGTFTYTGNAPTWGASSVLAYNPTLGSAGGTHSLTSGTEASGTPAEIRVLVPVSTVATTINYTLGADLTAGILDLRYRTDGTVCASSCSGYANHTVNVILNGRTLTLNTDFRSYGYSSQSFRGSASSSLVLGGTGALGGTLFFDQTTPGTTNALSVFTLNRTASGSATMGNNLLVGNTLNLTNGTLDLGANTLTMAGNSVTRTSGSLDADAGTLVFTNTLPLTLPASVFSGSVQHLTMSGSGGVTLGSDATVTGTLACTEGTLDIGANTLTISGNSVTRTSGTLDADMGSLAFINSLPLTLPASLFSGANVNNLTMSGGGGVTLGSSVTVTGTLALTSGTLDIGSHTFTQSGNTVTRTSGNVDADAGTFVLGNTQAITLPANVFAGSVNYLSINSAGVTQGSATTVTGTFEIITGHFVLDAYDLNMGTAVLSAGSPTGYVKTTGAGRMRREIGNMGGLFPVGRAYYNPVTIRNATGTDEVFSVRVDDAVYLNGQSGTQVTDKRVNATWFIDKATPNSLAGGGVDFTFYWNEAQKLQGITEFTLNHHDGTGWKTPVSTGTPSYSGTTLSFPGYKGTFSPFAIGSGASPLPVELRSFDAACADDRVDLEWITESEINNERFTVSRSFDMQHWEELLTLPGAGNSNAVLTYITADERPHEGINYYRLTQTDYDGAFEVLKTVSAFCAEGNVQVGWIVFPNPSEGVFTVQLLNGSELREGEILELSDLSGRMLRTIPYLTLTSTSLAADVSDLPAGVYFLHPRRMGAFGHPLRIIIR
jgi:hypothetical protein